jgi:hypothetical protein
MADNLDSPTVQTHLTWQFRTHGLTLRRNGWHSVSHVWRSSEALSTSAVQSPSKANSRSVRQEIQAPAHTPKFHYRVYDSLYPEKN